MANPRGQGYDHGSQGTEDEAGGTQDVRPEPPTSHLPLAEKHHRQSYPKSPFVCRFVTLLSTRPRCGRDGPDPATPPPEVVAAEEEVVGKIHSRLVGSYPSSSAAFGDHLPVSLLLLHQPGWEQSSGLRNPVEMDVPKPQRGETHLRLRTSVSSIRRSWAARSSSRRCWYRESQPLVRS